MADIVSYPSVGYVSELDPVTLLAMEEFGTELEQWLSQEHKPDGSHSAIHADSIDVSGDLSVEGDIEITGDLLVDDISADAISCTSLAASGQVSSATVLTGQVDATTVGAETVLVGASSLSSDDATLTVEDTGVSVSALDVHTFPFRTVDMNAAVSITEASRSLATSPSTRTNSRWMRPRAIRSLRAISLSLMTSPSTRTSSP